MRAAAVILAALVFFLLIGAVPVGGGQQVVIFHSPLFVLLLGLLTGSLLLCAAQRLRPLRLGFLLTHLGVVVILAGALAGFARGQRTECSVPVSADQMIRELPAADGRTPIDLGFSLGVTRFAVEHYPPDYVLYRPVPATNVPVVAVDTPPADYVAVRTIKLGTAPTLDLGPQGRLDVATLRNTAEEGEDWVAQYALPDGWLLQRQRPVDRHYRAEVRLVDPDGRITRQTLEVNRPVPHRGWRFYLMSYDTEARSYVVLSARRDPGRRWVIGGLWMLTLGIALVCFRRPGGGADDPRA